MRIALLFAGQGAQYPGMGQDLYDHSPAAKEIFNKAGKEVRDWCFHGTKEMLRQTHITQPAIYTVTMAAYEAFLEQLSTLELSQRNRLELVGVAGFSLGEYAALTAAGTIDSFEKGLEIVTKRGNMMDSAGRDHRGEPLGGMVAAFGARADILSCVEATREEGILCAVNYNSPIQTVVAGDFAALDRFQNHSKAYGVKSKILSVGTAFHSPLMEKAAEELEVLLRSMELQRPRIKTMSNVSGKNLMEGISRGEDPSEELAIILGKQACSPVYWQECMESLAEEQAEYYIEIGPGTTLSGIAKKILTAPQTLNIEDSSSLEKTMDTLIRELNNEMLGEEIC
ncbi:MAG TPA: ACP S-malonyltransferase [Bacillota bacterium]|nr:ACP S-malonyltransferase [Bacillota bacterium]